MTKERLEEIKDSIDLQLEVQRSVGYKSRYDDLLTEEIDLYNEVIDLQEKIDRAIEYIRNNYNLNWYVESNYKNELLEILKGEPKNECN